MMDSTNKISNSKSALLEIPSELRFMIYEHLTEFKGIIAIFAQYEIADEVDKQTIELMHVCRVVRREVQDIFYQNQTFDFRSHEAIQTFCKSVSPHHLSRVRNIEIGFSLSRRRIDFFKWEVCNALQTQLTGVKRLTITDPNLCYLTKFTSDVDLENYKNGYLHRAGTKVAALRAASGNLASGNLYYAYETTDIHLRYHQYNRAAPSRILSSKLIFVPKNCTFPRFVWGQSKNIGRVRFRNLTFYDPVY